MPAIKITANSDGIFSVKSDLSYAAATLDDAEMEVAEIILACLSSEEPLDVLFERRSKDYISLVTRKVYDFARLKVGKKTMWFSVALSPADQKSMLRIPDLLPQRKISSTGRFRLAHYRSLMAMATYSTVRTHGRISSHSLPQPAAAHMGGFLCAVLLGRRLVIGSRIAVHLADNDGAVQHMQNSPLGLSRQTLELFHDLFRVHIFGLCDDQCFYPLSHFTLAPSLLIW